MLQRQRRSGQIAKRTALAAPTRQRRLLSEAAPDASSDRGSQPTLRKWGRSRDRRSRPPQAPEQSGARIRKSVVPPDLELLAHTANARTAARDNNHDARSDGAAATSRASLSDMPSGASTRSVQVRRGMSTSSSTARPDASGALGHPGVHRTATLRARNDVRLDRRGAGALQLARRRKRHQLFGNVPAHASSSLSTSRARFIRVLTVPCGMPSSRPASAVVSPSRTVDCTTARNSGESRSSAPARSPYWTPSRTRSSAEISAPCSADRDHDRRMRPRRSASIESSNADPPDPRGNLTASVILGAPRQTATKVS